jgi:hypothetical protein
MPALIDSRPATVVGLWPDHELFISVFCPYFGIDQIYIPAFLSRDCATPQTREIFPHLQEASAVSFSGKASSRR